MDGFAQIAAVFVAAAAALVAAWGGSLWWRVEPAERWWPALRAVQALCAAFAVAAGVLYVAGYDPADGLFWLYAVLPVPVNFFAEQIRLVSAQTVLDARELEDSAALGRLPAEEQRSVVRQILRRELGVMVLACVAVTFLALRALGTT
jgi:hypothetical protein